jgi:hypothetical protein
MMSGTGVSGSSSGQAVGLDPGGLSHFRENPAIAGCKTGHKEQD